MIEDGVVSYDRMEIDAIEAYEEIEVNRHFEADEVHFVPAKSEVQEH